MGKPTEGILGRNEGQSLGNGLLKCLSRPSTLSAQKGLQFRERLFNGREIGRIRRQEQEATPSGLNSLFHTRSPMNIQIIQNHDLSSMQAGSQDLLNVQLKRCSIGSSIQDERFPHPLHRQGS